jgi:lipopolysaccharide biosynthesis glycosyltransferase
MNNSVIVIMANEAYLPQAKSLLVNCVKQGNWKGDLCLLTTENYCQDDFERRGIHVYQVSDIKWTWCAKFHIFSDFFRRWKRVLYLDCDVLVQGELNETVDGLVKQLPAILLDGCHGFDETYTIVHNWEHFDGSYGEGPDAHPEVYDKMRHQFPHVGEVCLSADIIFFAPETIEAGTVERLQFVAKEYKEANAGNADQPVLNLVLYDKMDSIGKDFCTWFAFDEPCNRVVCPARGWRGDEHPAILHYWNMYAPWLVKTPDAGAYFNYRLGRVCHEIYAENLAAFNEVFPLR